MMCNRIVLSGHHLDKILSYNFNSNLFKGALLSRFVTILLTSHMSLHKQQINMDFSCLVRSACRFLFLLISTFLFCFQQTAGLVYRAELSKEVHLRSKIQTESKAHQIGSQLYVQLPVLLAVEQLEPSEDDDQHHPQQALSTDSTRPLLLLEWAYAQAIRTSFRQQSSAVMQMNRPPLFLLHHQWRSIPS